MTKQFDLDNNSSDNIIKYLNSDLSYHKFND